MKNKNNIDYIIKERFLVWLMWLIPIACTGWFSVAIWTGIQIALCNSQKKERDYCKLPLRERPDIIEMNKPENLTEEDIKMMKSTGCNLKMGEGWYRYERE